MITQTSLDLTSFDSLFPADVDPALWLQTLTADDLSALVSRFSAQHSRSRTAVFIKTFSMNGAYFTSLSSSQLSVLAEHDAEVMQFLETLLMEPSIRQHKRPTITAAHDYQTPFSQTKAMFDWKSPDIFTIFGWHPEYEDVWASAVNHWLIVSHLLLNEEDFCLYLPAEWRPPEWDFSVDVLPSSDHPEELAEEPADPHIAVGDATQIEDTPSSTPCNNSFHNEVTNNSPLLTPLSTPSELSGDSAGPSTPLTPDAQFEPVQSKSSSPRLEEATATSEEPLEASEGEQTLNRDFSPRSSSPEPAIPGTYALSPSPTPQLIDNVVLGEERITGPPNELSSVKEENGSDGLITGPHSSTEESATGIEDCMDHKEPAHLDTSNVAGTETFNGPNTGTVPSIEQPETGTEDGMQHQEPAPLDMSNVADEATALEDKVQGKEPPAAESQNLQPREHAPTAKVETSGEADTPSAANDAVETQPIDLSASLKRDPDSLVEDKKTVLSTKLDIVDNSLCDNTGDAEVLDRIPPPKEKGSTPSQSLLWKIPGEAVSPLASPTADAESVQPVIFEPKDEGIGFPQRTALPNNGSGVPAAASPDSDSLASETPLASDTVSLHPGSTLPSSTITAMTQTGPTTSGVTESEEAAQDGSPCAPIRTSPESTVANPPLPSLINPEAEQMLQPEDSKDLEAVEIDSNVQSAQTSKSDQQVLVDNICQISALSTISESEGTPTLSDSPSDQDDLPAAAHVAADPGNTEPVTPSMTSKSVTACLDSKEEPASKKIGLDQGCCDGISSQDMLPPMTCLETAECPEPPLDSQLQEDTRDDPVPSSAQLEGAELIIPLPESDSSDTESASSDSVEEFSSERIQATEAPVNLQDQSTSTDLERSTADLAPKDLQSEEGLPDALAPSAHLDSKVLIAVSTASKAPSISADSEEDTVNDAGARSQDQSPEEPGSSVDGAQAMVDDGTPNESPRYNAPPEDQAEKDEGLTIVSPDTSACPLRREEPGASIVIETSSDSVVTQTSSSLAQLTEDDNYVDTNSPFLSVADVVRSFGFDLFFICDEPVPVSLNELPEPENNEGQASEQLLDSPTAFLPESHLTESSAGPGEESAIPITLDLLTSLGCDVLISCDTPNYSASVPMAQDVLPSDHFSIRGQPDLVSLDELPEPENNEGQASEQLPDSLSVLMPENHLTETSTGPIEETPIPITLDLLTSLGYDVLISCDTPNYTASVQMVQDVAPSGPTSESETIEEMRALLHSTSTAEIDSDATDLSLPNQSLSSDESAIASSDDIEHVREVNLDPSSLANDSDSSPSDIKNDREGTSVSFVNPYDPSPGHATPSIEVLTTASQRWSPLDHTHPDATFEEQIQTAPSVASFQAVSLPVDQSDGHLSNSEEGMGGSSCTNSPSTSTALDDVGPPSSTSVPTSSRMISLGLGSILRAFEVPVLSSKDQKRPEGMEKDAEGSAGSCEQVTQGQENASEDNGAADIGTFVPPGADTELIGYGPIENSGIQEGYLRPAAEVSSLEDSSDSRQKHQINSMFETISSCPVESSGYHESPSDISSDVPEGTNRVAVGRQHDIVGIGTFPDPVDALHGQGFPHAQGSSSPTSPRTSEVSTSPLQGDPSGSADEVRCGEYNATSQHEEMQTPHVPLPEAHARNDDVTSDTSHDLAEQSLSPSTDEEIVEVDDDPPLLPLPPISDVASSGVHEASRSSWSLEPHIGLTMLSAGFLLALANQGSEQQTSAQNPLMVGGLFSEQSQSPVSALQSGEPPSAPESSDGPSTPRHVVSQLFEVDNDHSTIHTPPKQQVDLQGLRDTSAQQNHSPPQFHYQALLENSASASAHAPSSPHPNLLERNAPMIQLAISSSSEVSNVSLSFSATTSESSSADFPTTPQSHSGLTSTVRRNVEQLIPRRPRCPRQRTVSQSALDDPTSELEWYKSECERLSREVALLKAQLNQQRLNLSIQLSSSSPSYL